MATVVESERQEDADDEDNIVDIITVITSTWID